MIDLHCHTTASDSLTTPCRIIENAVSEGLDTIAIADHDSVGGLKEASQIAGASGINFIPAVELSVEFPNGVFNSQGEHSASTVIPLVSMIEDSRKQLDMLAPITAVECIIGDQHLHIGGVGQWRKLITDHPGTQQQKESTPMGMDRVEKTAYRVLGHTAAFACIEGAKQVLPGKHQGEQNPEHGDRRKALLLADVAALQ